MTMPLSLRVRSPETVVPGGSKAEEIAPVEAARAGGTKLSAVAKWNDVLIGAVRNNTSPRGGPTWASRNMAMVQIAVYDAVNAIDGSSAPYALRERASSKHASKAAATAVAAHDVLVELYPEQQASLDAQLTSSLAEINSGPHKDAGMRIGRLAAEAMKANRSGDRAVPDPVFTPVNKPGHWQPDPLHPTQKALGPSWGDVTPFAMGNRLDFEVPPPPALNSREYTEAYNQVKSLGAKNSKTRTADMMEVGNFWAFDRAGLGPPMTMFNQFARQIAAQRHLPPHEEARLLAMVNMAMADAGIAGWGAKYDYDLWRPVTAIRAGKTDHNPGTARDRTWEPHGAPAVDPKDNFTPPFPAYPSGHAIFGGAFFRTLERFFGSNGSDHGGFNLTSEELPGVSRHYNSFEEASVENAMSRVYLGVHWLFDCTRGLATGKKIADRVWQTQMQPAGRPADGFSDAQKPSGPVL